jgi:tetratricopeptide (TPR) repeat protein
LLTDHGFWGRVSLNLLESDHFQAGLEAADRAISIDGGNVVYRNNRVVLLLKLDRPQEAAREWEEVLRLDPSLAKEETE